MYTELDLQTALGNMINDYATYMLVNSNKYTKENYYFTVNILFYDTYGYSSNICTFQKNGKHILFFI